MALASDPDELRSMVRVPETRSELGQHFDAYQRDGEAVCALLERFQHEPAALAEALRAGKLLHQGKAKFQSGMRGRPHD